MSKKLNCYGSAHSDASASDVTVMKEHTHERDYTSIEIASCRQSMKQRAQTAREKPGVIYTDALKLLSDEARSRMPTGTIIKRTLRNHKTENYPPVPTSLSSLTIEGDFVTTGGVHRKPFLVYDNGKSGSRIIIFASEDCLRLLGHSRKWYMDGNFSMAPKYFQQVR